MNLDSETKEKIAQAQAKLDRQKEHIEQWMKLMREGKEDEAYDVYNDLTIIKEPMSKKEWIAQAKILVKLRDETLDRLRDEQLKGKKLGNIL